jgi:hypothetical protein
MTIDVRDLPEETRRTLSRRARVAGVPLDEYIRSVLEGVAARPTFEEMAARLKSREPVRLSEPVEVTVRRLRDALD